MRFKAIFSVLILSLIAATTALAGGIEDLALKGDQAFRDGNYDDAIKAYKSVLEGGYVSGPVLYNLGNAYYKTGEIGLAILYYERALIEMPHDKDIRFNLDMARTYTVDRIEEAPRLAVWDWLDSLRDWLPPATLAWGGWIMATIAALLFAVALWIKHPQVRLWLRAIGFASIAVFFFFTSLLTLRFAEEQGLPVAIIMVDKVVVRSAPDATSSEVFHLHEGTRIEIVKKLESYFEIRLADGRQGWLPINSCEKVR